MESNVDNLILKYIERLTKQCCSWRNKNSWRDVTTAPVPRWMMLIDLVVRPIENEIFFSITTIQNFEILIRRFATWVTRRPIWPPYTSQKNCPCRTPTVWCVYPMPKILFSVRHAKKCSAVIVWWNVSNQTDVPSAGTKRQSRCTWRRVRDIVA